MTEPTTAPENPEPQPTEDPKPEATTGEPSTDLGDAGKRALAEERKARKAAEKEKSDLAARLKEFEDRDKSELDKATEAWKSAEAERDAAKAEALRFRVAAEFGISTAPDDEGVSDADLFLTGQDEETMRRQAQRFSARQTPAGPSVPKPDPSQGARGPVGMDARIAEAEKNGDVKASLALKSQQLLKK
ncbi:hypothetical protein [Amycolatopsis sp. NPDC001319]|uniref:hypothetical protein n=1 Tax=unclassified Amycolatopsis TaxID=2618356 RepID=UPI00368106B0